MWFCKRKHTLNILVGFQWIFRYFGPHNSHDVTEKFGSNFLPTALVPCCLGDIWDVALSFWKAISRGLIRFIAVVQQGWTCGSMFRLADKKKIKNGWIAPSFWWRRWIVNIWRLNTWTAIKTSLTMEKCNILMKALLWKMSENVTVFMINWGEIKSLGTSRFCPFFA